MKGVVLGVMLALGGATICNAGQPARGKVCHYTPRPTAPDPGLAYGKENCATSPYGEAGTDWVMGGNTSHAAGDVTVLDTGPPPYIIPGCEHGREMQVIVEGPSFPRPQWIFPRFLDCPD